jgi:SAM-dependent methyltransferase
MGIIEHIPADIEALYESDYYSSPDQRIGYADYAVVADHSTSWAANLAQLLCPHGRILDVGCADGRLLSKLSPTYERFGIEMNRQMRERCEREGIQIIANSIYDSRLGEFRGAFDVVLAVAVLEHVRDFRNAVRRALEMMSPNGVFIFEVPLLSDSPSDDVWLKTSLEHVYYPSESSLKHLFGDISEGHLTGTEVVIQDFGSTYLGVASKDARRAEEVSELFDRVVLGTVDKITSTQELVCRLLLSVVHAANTEPSYLERLGLLSLDADLCGSPILQRLQALWLRDRKRLDERTAYLAEVERARDYHADRCMALSARLEDTNGASGNDEPER